MELKKLLEVMLERQASDLFVSTGASVSIKIDGKVRKLTKDVVTYDIAQKLVLGVMNDDQKLEQNACAISLL